MDDTLNAVFRDYFSHFLLWWSPNFTFLVHFPIILSW